MGYYTSYSISLVQGDYEEYESLLKELAEISQEPEIVNESVYTKWYSQEKDCMEVSKRHPDILFEVSGDGEAGDDVWAQRWKGGFCEHVDLCVPAVFHTLLSNEERKNANWLVIIDLVVGILQKMQLTEEEYNLSREDQDKFMDHISKTTGYNLSKFSWGIVHDFTTLVRSQ